MLGELVRRCSNVANNGSGGGTSSLCIFGRPYSRGALELVGCSCLHRSSGSEDFSVVVWFSVP